MNILPITCVACGATIKAQPNQIEATCIFCNATVAIRPNTFALAAESANVALLQAENQLFHLEKQPDDFDKRWEREQQQYFTIGQYGKEVPSRGSGWFFYWGRVFIDGLDDSDFC